MYEVVRELIGKEIIPPFYEIEYHPPFRRLENIQEELSGELERSGAGNRICPGDRVAITAGSREIANILEILRFFVGFVKKKGARPYIVAAMGSHGGATGEGQRMVLAGYGICEESVGCPVISDMETELLGKTESGLDVYMDRFAAGCDKILVIGRVKAHTDFRGPVESGLAKMIAIGLGKQQGAKLCHKMGFSQMSKNVTEIARVALKKKPVAFGLAILEDAFHHTAKLKVVLSEEFEKEEPELLKQAKALMPRIPYKKTDILIVSEIGKNISGAGMDPNITGRSPRLGIGPPYAERLAVLGISEGSHGAGTGIGNADVITRRAYEAFDFAMTYPNAITSNDPESVKLPAVMPGDREAIQFAMSVLIGEWKGRIPKIVWIKNTSELERFYVTEPLLKETESSSELRLLKGPGRMVFDEDGYVKEWVKE